MKEIKLTKGYSAFVDDDDFERINAYKWCASIESRGTKVYAVRRERDPERPREWKTVTTKVKGKKIRKKRWTYPTLKIRMHRQVLGIPVYKKYEMVVDHLNGDSLDNRKENLEITTQEVNMSRAENWKRKEPEISL